MHGIFYFKIGLNKRANLTYLLNQKKIVFSGMKVRIREVSLDIVFFKQ